ncbi:unnamed protein product [Calypogeia fissa]
MQLPKEALPLVHVTLQHPPPLHQANGLQGLCMRGNLSKHLEQVSATQKQVRFCCNVSLQVQKLKSIAFALAQVVDNGAFPGCWFQTFPDIHPPNPL